MFFFEIGNATITSMWSDHWCDLGLLDHFIRLPDIFLVGFDINNKVADCIYANGWKVVGLVVG